MIHDESGVSWHEAPAPPRRHKCAMQTSGFVGGVFISRCACGGTRINHGPWGERNQRNAPRVRLTERGRTVLVVLATATLFGLVCTFMLITAPGGAR